MAIEDAYELANDLEEAWARAGGSADHFDVDSTFRRYQTNRMLRASAIHGMAGMAAFMASTYKVCVRFMRVLVIGRWTVLYTSSGALLVLAGHAFHGLPPFPRKAWNTHWDITR